jgi:hypothetical protein
MEGGEEDRRLDLVRSLASCVKIMDSAEADVLHGQNQRHGTARRGWRRGPGADEG